MKNLKINARVALFFAVCFFAAHAQEADSSLIAAQRATLNSLDSIEKNSLGFAVNGRAKGGIFASIIGSNALPEEEKQSEYMSYTDFLLSISIRPGNETRALFDLRFHKDWQSAYREGNNQPVISWWSYDGLVLNKKLKFNLGTMRVGYTPLTLATPNPSFIFEPKIFADMRAEAMADRYLDDSGRRLLQGVNFEINTPIGIIDNFYVQGTLARLRNNAKKMDQVFFDFDPMHDRYAAGARLGLEAFGIRLGVNDVYSFDRVRSTRIKTSDYAKAEESIPYEYNNVLSFEGGINSKKWLQGAVSFGANAELAISNWMYYMDYKETFKDTVIDFESSAIPLPGKIPVPIPCMNCPDIPFGMRYPYYVVKDNFEYRHGKVRDEHDQLGFLADVFVGFENSSIDAKLSGHYLKTDKGFESELAANPSYLPIMPILNSNAVLPSDSPMDAMFGQFRSGSLENLYYSLYYTLPLNKATMIAGVPGKPPAPSADKQLFNNYKLGQYYRNAYSYREYTYLERKEMQEYLDPSVNMALPYGYATPGRQGGDADLFVNWNDAILLRGVFGQYTSESELESDYIRFGGGLSMKIARLAGLPKPINISASFEQNKENGGSEREAKRIMAGFDAGIWRGLSLLGGVQLLDKNFGVPYSGFVSETTEMLVLGGPSVKMSERAFFVLQGGLLTNSISSIDGEKLDISKYVASGNVMVAF